ncbi:hypothetical protein [Sphingopyxis macrogoltabida]|uniref:Uncharacterized protein n=1 Tax=Sphingopyxis macrogoltabida TaxID=33050 RepID=A0AAC8Z2X8_SPHMC|nr:hypothetical protein [Sphingopyxis macrogoltabida]ALJ14310.1 hypothetical protein LH19_15675 [Sphingopyxis macrogoltabida]AMU90577.1 hypothetical protein ATM17_16255 [Sphingopyxis macrogoltabida]
MKPSIPVAASDLAARLRAEIVPELTGFRANNVAMGSAMIDMIAEEFDRAAARLFEENAAVRALLQCGGVAMAAPAKPDLRVSALEAENDRLRAALIDLQAALEDRDDDEARALDADIWRELACSVERRRVASANF